MTPLQNRSRAVPSLLDLNGNTTITSIFRRLGRNKPGRSGVHKCLRESLKSATAEEVRSVYDIASIIIDQNSPIFFDRTEPLDRRPEVMNLLASAIGSVTQRTIIAYACFGSNRETRSMGVAMQDKNNNSFLKINPEGALLRVSHNIAEELQIMLRIYKQQLHIVL
jgi:hypothetical protein